MAWTLDRALIVTALIAAALVSADARGRELVPFPSLTVSPIAEVSDFTLRVDGHSRPSRIDAQPDGLTVHEL